MDPIKFHAKERGKEIQSAYLQTIVSYLLFFLEHYFHTLFRYQSVRECSQHY
jgi:hypothetical protein